jgi:hypothetical protein
VRGYPEDPDGRRLSAQRLDAHGSAWDLDLLPDNRFGKDGRTRKGRPGLHFPDRRLIRRRASIAESRRVANARLPSAMREDGL